MWKEIYESTYKLWQYTEYVFGILQLYSPFSFVLLVNDFTFNIPTFIDLIITLRCHLVRYKDQRNRNQTNNRQKTLQNKTF